MTRGVRVGDMGTGVLSRPLTRLALSFPSPFPKFTPEQTTKIADGKNKESQQPAKELQGKAYSPNCQTKRKNKNLYTKDQQPQQ